MLERVQGLPERFRALRVFGILSCVDLSFYTSGYAVGITESELHSRQRG